VLSIPGMDEVIVRRDLPFAAADGGAALAMDLYLPPAPRADGRRHPLTLFPFGFPKSRFGKEMGTYTSWARLLAASGIAAAVHTYRNPVGDFDALVAHLREHGASLGIDATRLALWACSGNVPTALTILLRRAPGDDLIRGAALNYGLMLDLDGTTNVADAAAKLGFLPCAKTSLDDLRSDLPLLVTRAGKDAPAINHTIDGFVRLAIARNHPLTFINHATAPHAFDLFDDTEATREVIRQIVRFLTITLA
jgi:acetyl esterase/lipase